MQPKVLNKDRMQEYMIETNRSGCKMWKLQIKTSSSCNKLEENKQKKGRICYTSFYSVYFSKHTKNMIILLIINWLDCCVELENTDKTVL